jgi:hypothetical protein
MIRTHHKSPYEYVDMHMGFLEPKNLRWIVDPSEHDLDVEYSQGQRFLALIDIPAQPSEATNWIRRQCTFVWSTYPRWLQPYNFNHWEERSSWWELYRCERHQLSGE